MVSGLSFWLGRFPTPRKENMMAQKDCEGQEMLDLSAGSFDEFKRRLSDKNQESEQKRNARAARMEFYRRARFARR